jgi:glycosyltransferase involved in cell wall biosynthesis
MNTSQTQKLTVFIGIYNGEKYLESLQKQLLSQTYQDFHLVVIDNSSTDNSWEALASWPVIFGEKLVLHRNDKNLGSGGSLVKALNSGLISTKWFTTMHQDDDYFARHIEKLVETIQSSPDDVVAVCTGMASMDENSQSLPTPPRASWLVDDYSTPNSFLINLRTQTLSFPTTAFRTEEFSQCFRFWHSPTFSDTETTLLLCGHGEFRYNPQETMRYRENPQSESHVINSVEALLGATVSLSRVFTSEEFRTVLSKVDLSQRGLFFDELMSSIEIRLRESSLLYLVKVLASEACANAWEYKESQPSVLLSEFYEAVNSRFTQTLLSNLSGEPVPEPKRGLSEELRILSGDLSQEVFSKHSRRKTRLNSMFSKFPLVFRIRIFRAYVRLFAIKQPNHYWNAFWK